MNVRLVAMSQPSNGTTPESFIVHAARVSNPASAAAGGGEARLISYLIRNKHWSPFEMVSVTLEIQTTRDIGRQILRHRSFAFQEFSQRYAEVPDAPAIRAARMQDNRNRQNSTDDATDYAKDVFGAAQRRVWSRAREAYQTALDMGIAKEQARVFLPEGLTPSTIYMAGTLRSWLHYVALRDGNGTQAEHAEIARACRSAISEHFPLTMAAAA